jgi:hypothetical protein
MLTLTCPHFAVSLHPHVLHRRAPCPLLLAHCTSLGLHHRMRHDAVPLTTGHTMSPCSLHWLICLYAFPFSFFYLPSSFAVQSSYPNGTMVMWP